MSRIYRGDKRGNSTLPQLYRTEGIHSKLINGGNSAYVSQVGLAQAIKVHVSPSSSVEKILRSKSSFLSFSLDFERAKFYAADQHPRLLNPCDPYKETRYIFSLDTNDFIETRDQGVFSLKYECDYELVRPNALTMPDVILSGYVRCRFCKGGREESTDCFS